MDGTGRACGGCAGAAAWSVDDTTDTPVGQACPGFTGCSLREAVTSAEANPGADSILVSAGTYALTNGQLTVTQDLVVARVGAGTVTIDGNDTSRIFDVTGGIFTVRFLTLTHGLADGGAGVGEGGAIRTAAGTELHVESTTPTTNVATGDAGARGGAISAQGDVFIERASGSTTAPVLTGNNVGNSVAASGASTSQGAVFSGSARGGRLLLAGSILVENTGGGQCAEATLSSAGYNVLENVTGCTGAPAASDVIGVTDAGLSPLAGHGGLTQTRPIVEVDLHLHLRDPNGHRIELYEGDYYTGDPDHEPIRWSASDPRRRSLWGHHVSDRWYEEGTLVARIDDGGAMALADPIVDERVPVS
jgi:hypothetical protein